MTILLNKQINWFWGWRSKASVSWVSFTFSLKRLNKVKVSLPEFYFWFSLSEREHFIWMGYTALRCLQWSCPLVVTVWCNPILFSVGWAGDYPLMNRRQEWWVVSSKIKLQRLWLLSGMPFHALSQLTCSKGNQLPFLSHLIDGPLGEKTTVSNQQPAGTWDDSPVNGLGRGSSPSPAYALIAAFWDTVRPRTQLMHKISNPPELWYNKCLLF